MWYKSWGFFAFILLLSWYALLLIVKNSFKHWTNMRALDMVTYVSLHGECFACACWPVHHHVAAFAFNEGITEFFSTLIKDFILTLVWAFLLVKHIFKVEISLSIVKIVIGKYLKTLLVSIHINDFLGLFLPLKKRSHPCWYLNKYVFFLLFSWSLDQRINNRSVRWCLDFEGLRELSSLNILFAKGSCVLKERRLRKHYVRKHRRLWIWVS